MMLIAMVAPTKQHIANICLDRGFNRKAQYSVTTAKSMPQKAPAVSQFRLDTQPN